MHNILIIKSVSKSSSTCFDVFTSSSNIIYAKVTISGRGLCDGLIIRSEESNRLWRVVVCDQETS